MNRLLILRRRALVVFFFLPGMAMASWITRSADIRDGLGASLSEMGVVLFGLSMGAMSGLLLSKRLVSWLGTRTVILLGLCQGMAALVVIGAGVGLACSPAVMAGLYLMGLGIGSSEIAMNVDGADIEVLSGRTFLPLLHGYFSLGTAAGALLGYFASAMSIPVSWHLAAIAAIVAPVTFSLISFVPPGLGRQTAAERAEPLVASRSLLTDPRLLCLAIFVLAMAAAEGAANEWLPLLIADDFGGGDNSLGAIMFMIFALAMSAGRMCANYIVHHFGRDSIMVASAVTAMLGLGAVIFSQNHIVAGLAIILWGMGAALGFPLGISAAGQSGPDPVRRIRMVALFGYLAFLASPPLLGFVGQHHGLRNALLIVLGLLVAASVAAHLERRLRSAGRPGLEV